MSSEYSATVEQSWTFYKQESGRDAKAIERLAPFVDSFQQTCDAIAELEAELQPARTDTPDPTALKAGKLVEKLQNNYGIVAEFMDKLAEEDRNRIAAAATLDQGRLKQQAEAMQKADRGFLDSLYLTLQTVSQQVAALIMGGRLPSGD